jgi:hypothetical protein
MRTTFGGHKETAEMKGWQTQVASDVHRDGLGVELLDAKGDVVAEVFRSDADHTVIVTTFSNDVPLPVIEWFIDDARERLDSFEDGTPLPPRGQQVPNKAAAGDGHRGGVR